MSTPSRLLLPSFQKYGLYIRFRGSERRDICELHTLAERFGENRLTVYGLVVVWDVVKRFNNDSRNSNILFIRRIWIGDYTWIYCTPLPFVAFTCCSFSNPFIYFHDNIATGTVLPTSTSIPQKSFMALSQKSR